MTFGGAYAVLAYVAQQAVERYHWMAPRRDARRPRARRDHARAAHHGRRSSSASSRRSARRVRCRRCSRARLGALLTTWVTFVPCFLWIFLGAPYIEALRGQRALNAALSAITAAVVGVILNLAVWFALHMLFRQTFPVQGLGFAFDAPVFSSVDVPALVLSIAAATAIFRFNVGMLVVLAASCVTGVLLRVRCSM